MNFEEALAYMQGRHRFGIKLGNERFEALLDRLEQPHRRYGIAHIAGTKGKGSTTAMIAAILTAHGFRTGGYYSPYVYDVRERVQVDGEMIPPEDFARLVTQIAPHIAALEETLLGSITEFELKTAVGFCHFAARAADYAAIEVGIGGRLDATNVVMPLVSVITNIGLDHVQILGDTHAKIAAEKAGIIKPGIPVLTATEEPSALEVICRTAQERNAPLTRIVPIRPAGLPSSDRIHYENDTCSTFQVWTSERAYPDLRLRLQGAYQRINAACAIGAVEKMAQARGFSVSLEAVQEGLRRAYLPGRLEVINRRPLVIMDGAHNDISAQALAQEIRIRSYRRLLLVVGITTGHAPEGILEPLASLADRVYATQPLWIKGVDAGMVAETARRWCIQVETLTPPLEAARAALREASTDDLVLITGSFYTVGDVRPDELLR
jgi:dihydrofolate synthase/folylpolyglutamate synthase